MPPPSTSHALTAHWEWKQRDPALQDVLAELALGPAAEGADAKSGWRAACAFPSEVHVELQAAGLIPDPHVAFNEHRVQWVGRTEWLYRTAFALPDAAPHAALVFDGLDTVVDVYLNGHHILAADNQFREHTLVLARAHRRAHNTLLLHFKSAPALAEARERQYGRVRAGSANLGDPSRVYVRKAQYDWRWDWGPELLTAGPYRAVRVHTYAARLAHVHARTRSLPAAALALDVCVAGAAAGVRVRAVLRDAAGRVVREGEGAVGAGEVGDAGEGDTEARDVVAWAFGAGEVGLWWPVGYGAQTLYALTVVLLAEDGTPLDTHTQRTGFRDVRLVQAPLAHADQYGAGSTFLFEVNGVRIFMGGSNWIPADSFLTRITPARYRAWLTLLRDGNQNMVRLWGGGVYEPDVFYDTCDELGILVWQDFQFACGIYPAHPEFVASVRAEARDTVRRLRHHPSLALFCGNNEDYQQVLQWDVPTDLPARVLYEHVLPDTVAALTGPAPAPHDAAAPADAPHIPYHRGSPYGGHGWDTSDPTVGDVHQWNVWGGKERAWQDYDALGGRFVSEFGIPAFPALALIKHWCGALWPARDPPPELHAQAPIMAQHCRAGMHERRFAILLNENMRATADLETHVFRTQVLQSEAVGYAYRVWRREWRGPGREFCGGVLVWQLNDCWPVTSWAIADYYLRPKPVYYAIKRELAPLTIGLLRTVAKNRENDRPKQFYEFGAFQTTGATLAVWGTNSTLAEEQLTLHLDAYLLSPESAPESAAAPFASTTHAVVLLPNRSTPLLEVPLALPAGAAAPEGVHVVVHARLRDAAGAVRARASDWPQPFRCVRFADPGLRLARVGRTRVRVAVLRPVKALVLALADGGAVRGEGEGEWARARWSDNALDLVPGDPVVVRCAGLEAEGVEVTAAWMGGEKARVVEVRA